MKYEFYEGADMDDPLAQLLRREEEDMECDILESQYRAALHRTKTMELDRYDHEQAAQDSLH